LNSYYIGKVILQGMQIQTRSQVLMFGGQIHFDGARCLFLLYV